MLAGCGGGGGAGDSAVAPVSTQGNTGTQPESPPAPAPAPVPAPRPVEGQVPVTPPSPVPAPSPAPAPAPAAVGLSSNIVMWGDSMVPAVAANLQALLPNRVVENQGFLGLSSTAIASQQRADTNHRHWINIFWYGHNNELASETIKADLAASIANLAPGNDRFMVLGLVNHANERGRAGTLGHASVVRLNADLAALYPANFVDMRAWLLAHFNPNDPIEAADHTNDVPASSLRYDEIHLRNEGSLLVAQRIAHFIEAKGW